MIVLKYLELHRLIFDLSPWKSCMYTKILQPRLYVLSDSVLCLGTDENAIPKLHKLGWNKAVGSLRTQSRKQLNNLNGAPFVFECCFEKSRKRCRSSGLSRRMFRTGSYSCHCTTSLIGLRRSTNIFAIDIRKQFLWTPAGFPRVIGHSLVQEAKEK